MQEQLLEPQGSKPHNSTVIAKRKQWAVAGPWSGESHVLANQKNIDGTQIEFVKEG
jgi:hypothetical protein